MEHSPEVCYNKIKKEAHIADFIVETATKNKRVELKGGRDYSTGILVILILVGVLLFLIGLVIAAIYYWTRPYKKMIINIEPTDTGGSQISVTTYEKRSSGDAMRRLKVLLAYNE